MRITSVFKTVAALTVTALCLIGRAQVAEEEAAEAPGISVTVTSQVLSQYLFMDTIQVFHRDPVTQSEVEVSFPLGFYATLWHSTDFDSNFSDSAGDEIDWYIGWSGDVGPVSLDIGVSYFDAVGLFVGPANDTFYGYIEVSKTFETSFGSVTPYTKGGFYQNGDGSEVEGGTVFSLGLRGEWQTPLEKLSVPFCGQVAHDDGAFGNESGSVSFIGLEANWQITDSIVLRLPTFSVGIPINVDDDREFETVIGGGVEIVF